MKVSDKLIGKICRNNDGRQGLVTCIKGDEARGIGLDGKGNWASRNPSQVRNHSFAVGVCHNGRIGIYTDWQYNDIRGIGLDGKPWRSTNSAELVQRGGIEDMPNVSWKMVQNILKG